ncbi:SNase-domain-containing protein [Aaosphaeria arxii CBS 175.79]|uniref:Probable endonuclease LCL3 n=1 Tax=Aaosphaeria arxii CBS 175.79 TaxID=1450172 RepID=A0A6A5XJK5_9PLEO|nr:SNase-domain-containing protein [Aaosphaeria arxii CBS 175.79]KAF2013302.1 SNase-domain-containing protein [Aaosphaeria arxii CBS 175.79]
MRWPWSGDDNDKTRSEPSSWADLLDTSKWSWDTFTGPGALVPSIVFTVTSLSALRIYKSYLRRIPSVNHIKPDYFRRRSLFGQVSSVGDADNFRLFHTPGGRLSGWGWLPWKRVPTTREGLTNKTIHIRIAGVDAPELAHWGREAQPFSKEAYDWLTQYIHNRRVRAYIYRRDQYGRVVAQVFIRKWFVQKDVGLEMLKQGLATVYEAKTGSEFGKSEQIYRDAEQKAKANHVGMWSKPSLLGRLRGESAKAPESPREYKSRHNAADKLKKGA